MCRRKPWQTGIVRSLRRSVRVAEHNRQPSRCQIEVAVRRMLPLFTNADRCGRANEASDRTLGAQLEFDPVQVRLPGTVRDAVAVLPVLPCEAACAWMTRNGRLRPLDVPLARPPLVQHPEGQGPCSREGQQRGERDANGRQHAPKQRNGEHGGGRNDGDGDWDPEHRWKHPPPSCDLQCLESGRSAECLRRAAVSRSRSERLSRSMIGRHAARRARKRKAPPGSLRAGLVFWLAAAEISPPCRPPREPREAAGRRCW